nr:retrovirus-related Pol polyprotein from transposon TNT 1-94 [Tanacetum cinerariifolium]
LNAKTLNVKFVSIMCDKCGLIDKYDMCVLKSVAKPLKETVASKSNKTPTNFTRNLYDRVSKKCSWWYSKFTPSGYIWKPKSRKENVNPNVSMPLRNASRTANIMDTVTSRYGDLVQGAVTIKRVYYVEGLNHNLFFVGQFCDADLEVAFRKSTFFIRDLKGNDLLTGGDKLVSWSSKKQDYTSMSSTEAEYVSLSACCAQVLWMRTQFTDYGFYFNKIPMYCDSKAAIAISCNPVQHSRTKHIDVCYHFIKEKVEKGIVEQFFVGTEYQLADLFTKALPVERFRYLVRRLGMRCLTPTKLEALPNESA